MIRLERQAYQQLGLRKTGTSLLPHTPVLSTNNLQSYCNGDCSANHEHVSTQDSTACTKHVTNDGHSLLLVLTPLSYLPQYKTLLSTRNANGISVTAALMLALCAQSQIPTMYYLFACPVYKRDGSIIPTPPRLVDYLNLAQLLMQWLCSLLLYVP